MIFYMKIKTFLKSIYQNIQKIKYGYIYNLFRDFTMIPPRFYKINLKLARSFSHITGSVVECGVWRGGMIAGIAKLFNDERSYYLFDSFDFLGQAFYILLG